MKTPAVQMTSALNRGRVIAYRSIFLSLLLMLLAAGAVFYLRLMWIFDSIVRAELRLHGVHSEFVTVKGGRIHYVGGTAKRWCGSADCLKQKPG